MKEKDRTKLYEVMAAKKLRVDWLEEQTGISRQSISNYRSGKSKPTKAYQKLIAEVLNVEIKDLF